MEQWYLYGETVQRMKIPGGWLYRVDHHLGTEVVFVPEQSPHRRREGLMPCNTCGDAAGEFREGQCIACHNADRGRALKHVFNNQYFWR